MRQFESRIPIGLQLDGKAQDQTVQLFSQLASTQLAPIVTTRVRRRWTGSLATNTTRLCRHDTGQMLRWRIPMMAFQVIVIRGMIAVGVVTSRFRRSMVAMPAATYGRMHEDREGRQCT